MAPKKHLPHKPHPDQWLTFSPDWQKNRIEQDARLLVPSPAGRYFHRDLSWLQFNDRVLSEAADDSVPALERLRFAGIVSSNLDEFFMIRVAKLIRSAALRRGGPRHSPHMTAHRVLAQIRSLVLNQKARQAAVLRDILTDLVKQGIIIYTDFAQDREHDEAIRQALPRIQYLIRRNTEALPTLTSDMIHIFIRFPEEYAVLSLDTRQARLLLLPSTEKTVHYALVERWLSARAQELFPDREVIEAFPFKIIRDADLRYHPDDEESLEDQILEGVQKRTKARIVRLEVDAPAYSEGALYLATALGLNSGALYRFDLPLDLRTLARIYNMRSFRHLRYPPIRPRTPNFLVGTRNIFNTIRRHDVLLHHPYDSFDVIVRFLTQAARDRHVTRIYHTLYRTSKESPIMEALKDAVKWGKKVTVYIELKARFDELNNLRWAQELRDAGVKVVRPIQGFKVHCKLTQVIRHESGEDIAYLHLGTGNYHPATARQYTDLGLLTSEKTMGGEVGQFFNSLSRRRAPSGFEELLVAPGNLHQNFEKLIREETANQKRGSKGHIIAKMNSLVDQKIIDALYEASSAGVKVDLLVRGICSLRPGVPGLSEHITVTSVVDRFLEHSRIYYFRANGARKLYLSSADWMPRNFYTRYEIAFPIKDLVLKRFVRDVILGRGLADNVKAWRLGPDGTYTRVPTTGKPVRSQFDFEELANNNYRDTILKSRLNVPPVVAPKG